MSDLKRGSTIGGNKIITELTANHHSHPVTQVSGIDFNWAMFFNDGEGSDLDVDTLDGKVPNDLDAEFLFRSGGTMEGDLILNEKPGDPASGITRAYTDTLITTNTINVAGVNPFRMVGDELVLSQSGTTTIYYPAFRVLMDGIEHDVTGNNASITNFTNDTINTTLYVSFEYSNSVFILDIENVMGGNTASTLYVGEITTDNDGGIVTVSTYSPLWYIDTFHISAMPGNNRIPLSGTNGKLTNAWFNKSPEHGSVVSLVGPTTINSGGTYQYTIQDYSSFATYTVSSSIGSTSITDQTITFNVPSNINGNTTIMLYVTRNGVEVPFHIHYVGEIDFTGAVSQVWAGTNGGGPQAALQNNDMVSIGNKIYLCGNSNNDSEFWEYDTVANAWSILTTSTVGGNRYTSGSKMASIGGEIYVLGGNDGGVSHNRFWKYNTGTQTFTTLTPFPMAIEFHQIVSNDDKVFCVGGEVNEGGNITTLTNIYEYDVQNDTWTMLPGEFINNEILKGHVAEYFDGSIFIHGGDVLPSVHSSQVWRYQLTTNDWIAVLSSTLLSTFGHASTIHNGKVYLFGGVNNDALYEYIPFFDSVAPIDISTTVNLGSDDVSIAYSNNSLYYYENNNNAVWRIS